MSRDNLRRVMIHDKADRDAIAAQLFRYRDQTGDDWADIIDMLTMRSRGALSLYADARHNPRAFVAQMEHRPAGRGRGY
jgi:hypothetical protein